MSLDPRGYALGADEGEPWWFLDARMTLKATGEETRGAFTVLEWQAPVGFGPPRHVHEREDEVFYVLDGAMQVVCDDRSWEVGPGGFAFLPRGVEHCFVVTDGPIRGLQLTAPAQFERYVERIGRPPEHAGLPEPSMPDVPALVAAAEDLGIQIVGPPMGLPTHADR
jgi:mannose-6-phosphate isomerase-like protein (cupin superfamily)